MIRLSLTFLWAVALAAFFQWWEITLRAGGLLVWTTTFLGLYVATAAALQGPALRSRRHKVWKSAAAWAALVALTVLAHRVLPQVGVAGQRIPTIVFVGALDVGFPLWILIRVLAETWTGPARWAVLGGVPLYLFLLLWAFVIRMPGRSHAGPLPTLSPEEQPLRDSLQRHVNVLAQEIGERHEGSYPALLRAAAYVQRALAGAGYTVDTLAFDVGGRRYVNLRVTIPGTRRADEQVIIGAHYDTAEGTPGADDNASGTAALIELARRFAGARPARTLEFVFFPNEEPPFFATQRMGSWQYAARARAAGDRVTAMISLETIGYYSTDPGSQRYPFPFNLFYPDRGDFIGFVGNLDSRSLVHRAIAAFRTHYPFPSQGVASPAFIPGVSWSDHQSFWQHGYQAIMISDTAPFRNPNYHRSSDTADRLDFDRMTRVVSGLVKVIETLAEE